MAKQKTKRRRRRRGTSNAKSNISINTMTPHSKFKLAYRWRAGVTNQNTPSRFLK